MGAFEVADVLQVIDRHLGAVAAAATETEHAIEVTEAVMWLWMLGEHFKVWKELPDEERKRLSGLFHARHQGPI